MHSNYQNLPCFLEMLRSSRYVIVSALKIIQGSDFMPFAGGVDVSDGYGGSQSARNAVEEGTEIPDLSVVHDQLFRIGIDRAVSV